MAVFWGVGLHFDLGWSHHFDACFGDKVKTYLPEDIEKISFCDAIRRRATSYFGNKEPSALAVAQGMEHVANTLGVGRTLILEMDGWCYFCAEFDWIFSSKVEIKAIEEVFFHFQPFPEGGTNSYRYEALCGAFSSDILTYLHDNVLVLKGSLPKVSVRARHLEKLGQWERIVGFRILSNDCAKVASTLT